MTTLKFYDRKNRIVRTSGGYFYRYSVKEIEDGQIFCTLRVKQNTGRVANFSTRDFYLVWKLVQSKSQWEFRKFELVMKKLIDFYLEQHIILHQEIVPLVRLFFRKFTNFYFLGNTRKSLSSWDKDIEQWNVLTEEN